jgi:purine-cytosine permease-like protein
MEKSGKATVSLAVIVLICFFLPWVQASCGTSHDTATGLDLARDGETGLWLIPLLMVIVIICGLRLLRINQVMFSLVLLLSGLVSVYLMNRERLKFQNSSGLVAARLTGGFWLGLVSAIAVVVSGAFTLLQRPGSP